MQPECRQHPTAQPEGLSKDYSARYSCGILSLSNYGPYKPCNPWHLSAGLVMQTGLLQESLSSPTCMNFYTNLTCTPFFHLIAVASCIPYMSSELHCIHIVLKQLRGDIRICSQHRRA